MKGGENVRAARGNHTDSLLSERVLVSSHHSSNSFFRTGWAACPIFALYAPTVDVTLSPDKSKGGYIAQTKTDFNGPLDIA